jgi:hypothetical protein
MLLRELTVLAGLMLQTHDADRRSARTGQLTLEHRQHEVGVEQSREQVPASRERGQRQTPCARSNCLLGRALRRLLDQWMLGFGVPGAALARLVGLWALGACPPIACRRISRSPRTPRGGGWRATASTGQRRETASRLARGLDLVCIGDAPAGRASVSRASVPHARCPMVGLSSSGELMPSLRRIERTPLPRAQRK